jgi:hypothetical protein
MALPAGNNGKVAQHYLKKALDEARAIKIRRPTCRVTQLPDIYQLVTEI